MMKIVLLLGMVSVVNGLNNGIGLTPPMGWMTWERFRCQLDCENRTDCLDENVSESENVAYLQSHKTKTTHNSSSKLTRTSCRNLNGNLLVTSM